MLHSEYDAVSELWTYDGNGYDEGNIIALRKGTYYAAHKGAFSIYTLNEADKDRANDLAALMEDTIAYYQRSFSPRALLRLDIFSMGNPANSAYFRKELLFADGLSFSNDPEEQRTHEIALLAHELAHNWFYSANTSTWEDWLNETGANWAALLYAVDCVNERTFDFILKNWTVYQDTPRIQSTDGVRPSSGVRTAMLYQIYLAKGEKAILTILRAFLTMETPTTAGVLSVLRAQSENALATYIEDGIQRDAYVPFADQ